MKQSRLLKTALIGTNRLKSEFGDTPHAKMHALWSDLEAQPDPADALLKAAALEHAAWHAGVKSKKVTKPEPCQAENQPYVPQGAAVAAVDLMQSAYKSFIAEWVDVAQRNGLLAPPRLLPALLSHGDVNPGTRASIAKVVGHRGLWLAAQSNRWQWLSGDASVDDSLWKNGTMMERRLWLTHQMQVAPEKASEAIVHSWPGDSPEAREVYAELAARYPHTEHEVWLQKWAVVDRRQSTRHQAIQALMKIPQSGFRQRSLQRAGDILGSGRKLFSKKHLTCIQPEEFVAEWSTDGLREKPPAGSGPKAFWMLQILGTIPLRDWPALVDNPEPFTMKIDDDWSDLVLKAWRASAVLHPDAELLQPLLHRLSAAKNETLQISSLVALLASVKHSEVADVLEPLKLSQVQKFELLLRCQPPLSAKKHPTLHKAATDWVFNNHPANRPDAIVLAGCCDCTEIAGLLKRISKLDNLSSPVEEFARALEYRNNYLRHFAELHELPGGTSSD